MNRFGLAGVLGAGAVVALLIAGPAAHSAPPAGSVDQSAGLGPTSAAVAASAADDRLANAFGLSASARSGPIDPTYFDTQLTPTGLEVAVTSPPSATQLAEWQQTAAPVPVTVRVVSHTMQELNAATDVVTANIDAIKALGIEPTMWAPDYASNLVVITVEQAFAPELTAQVQALVGPLVTLDYGSAMCDGSGAM